MVVYKIHILNIFLEEKSFSVCVECVFGVKIKNREKKRNQFLLPIEFLYHFFYFLNLVFEIDCLLRELF